jgi:hypothetical protein
MSTSHTPVLSEPVWRVLQAGSPAILITTGEDGWGHGVMTWAVAVASDRVRFGVDHGTRTVANLQRTGKAALQVIARDNILVLIKGQARQVRARIDAAPFGMEMWEATLTEVKDQTFGGVIVSPLHFEWIGPRAEEMRAVERAVLEELREWCG